VNWSVHTLNQSPWCLAVRPVMLPLRVKARGYFLLVQPGHLAEKYVGASWQMSGILPLQTQELI